jgi:hypothetical protein
MFLVEEVPLALPPEEARHRMQVHLHLEGLQDASAEALVDSRRTLMQAGVTGLSKQVQAQVRPAYLHADTMVVPLRWIATGATGGLFPELDANLEIAPDGEGASQLRLTGSYRPPLGTVGASIDRVVLHRLAEGTFRSFLRQLSEKLLAPHPAYEADLELELLERW